MSLGRHNQKNYTWMTFHGQDGSASLTSLIMSTDNYVTLFTGAWNPGLPSAARLTRVHTTSQCAVDTVAGNWTLNFYKNEGVVADATFTVPMSTTMQKSAGPWSNQLLLQAGETFWISGSGPEKNTVIIRAVLEFEIL